MLNRRTFLGLFAGLAAFFSPAARRARALAAKGLKVVRIYKPTFFGDYLTALDHKKNVPLEFEERVVPVDKKPMFGMTERYSMRGTSPGQIHAEEFDDNGTTNYRYHWNKTEHNDQVLKKDDDAPSDH